jgi:hypothetical protein
MSRQDDPIKRENDEGYCRLQKYGTSAQEISNRWLDDIIEGRDRPCQVALHRTLFTRPPPARWQGGRKEEILSHNADIGIFA